MKAYILVIVAGVVIALLEITNGMNDYKLLLIVLLNSFNNNK